MITIVDYGLGNIYKRLNIDHKVAKTSEQLADASKIVLPGVGAFDYAMTLLNQSGMREMLDMLVLEKQIPVLGVCVGMQIMASSSEEGQLAGLNWIPGRVKKFDVATLLHKPTIPHMGWNQFTAKSTHPIFEDIDAEQGFYFLHSYYFECESASDIFAHSEYGIEFSSAVHRQNIFGFQFHPEKSLSNGVALLKNFAGLS
jgi:glutamine amidotransferase